MKTMTVSELTEKFKLGSSEQHSDIIIIDIRSPEEYRHEHIHAAINIPISEIHTLTDKQYTNKIAIFHCSSGTRTQLNQSALASTAFQQTYCLNGGIEAWKRSGLEVNKAVNAPIDVMRQVQIIVGLMIVLGLSLSNLSTYFLLLPAVAGIGMLIAGITGFCGMAEILKFLPWNRARIQKVAETK